MGFEQHYRALLEEVANCCEACGRSAEEVRLIAVSKTVDIDAVKLAASAGACDFGENRPEELARKQEQFPALNWHFIGNIQSRRIPEIVAHARLIHSLFQPHHIGAIEQAASALGKVQDVLLEVNVSGEESKDGLAASEVASMLEQCGEAPHIRVCGLMTMAPQGDAALARETFEGLAELAATLRQRFGTAPVGQDLHDLSMGMSEDWREAIAAGATMIRLGRVVFDESFQLKAEGL